MSRPKPPPARPHWQSFAMLMVLEGLLLVLLACAAILVVSVALP